MEPEMNEGLNIRGMNETARRIGSIITHAILLIGVIFAKDTFSNYTDIFNLLLTRK